MNVNAERIKSLRTVKGWTQQHLADACDISLRTVQRVERYGNASNETLMSLSAVFEIQQSEIVEPDEPLEVVEHIIHFDIKRERKLIIITLSLGVTIGALFMYLINQFI